MQGGLGGGSFPGEGRTLTNCFFVAKGQVRLGHRCWSDLQLKPWHQAGGLGGGSPQVREGEGRTSTNCFFVAKGQVRLGHRCWSDLQLKPWLQTFSSWFSLFLVVFLWFLAGFPAPPWAYFRLCVSVAVFLLTETPI